MFLRHHVRVRYKFIAVLRQLQGTVYSPDVTCKEAPPTWVCRFGFSHFFICGNQAGLRYIASALPVATGQAPAGSLFLPFWMIFNSIFTKGLFHTISFNKILLIFFRFPAIAISAHNFYLQCDGFILYADYALSISIANTFIY